MIGPVKRKFESSNWDFTSSIGLNISFGCLKEPSHYDGSFAYSQHVFWLKNEKKFNYIPLSGGWLYQAKIKKMSCFWFRLR